jgi:pimeloyl-ACP methyl ester carboxylesterase/spore coat polysaccharide biosynthesis predicted glycosyltransferase SpsG
MTEQDHSILGAERAIRRAGCRIGYRVAGAGGPVVLLYSAWQIVHSAAWRGQVPWLAGRVRVITIDCIGNGRSDRPDDTARYHPFELVADAIAVLDAEGVDVAFVGGFSYGGHLAALTAARHPERVRGAILIAPTAPFSPSNPAFTTGNLTAERAAYCGWEKYNFHHWRRDYPDFVDFFMREVFPEAHSEKQIEDGIAWAAETDSRTLIHSVAARRDVTDQGEAAYSSIRCPVLVIQGTEDRIVPHAKGEKVAQLTKARFLSIPGAGHMPGARYPVAVNRALSDFLDAQASPALGTPILAPGLRRGPKALYLSSPIGLGHVRRDLAIARSLRDIRPDVTVDWLAQSPVTRLLEKEGEAVHPASEAMLSEVAHVAREADGHGLNAFQCLRRMDAILTANFCRFQEVVERERYDLVIADEAWEVDRFWHEHPELKRARLVWMTDFVGVLPLPEGGAEEARLAADWNAEMIGWIEGRPGVRDLSLYIGDAADLVETPLGEGLPGVREWSEAHFRCLGYVDPLAGRAADMVAREPCDRHVDEIACLVAVGGSGIGRAMIERLARAAPHLASAIPGFRFHIVTGPAIDPRVLPRHPALHYHGFVPDFPTLAAACDVAIVQGGLSSCMELASLGKPFAYVPLERHFEQQIHVDHRLRRHGVGHRVEFADLADLERLETLLLTMLNDKFRRPNLDLTGDATATAAAIAHLI